MKKIINKLLHEDAKEETSGIEKLSPQEKEVYHALEYTIAQRYQDCVDSGMSHDQTMQQIAIELKQALEDSPKPGVQNVAGKLLFEAAKTPAGKECFKKAGAAIVKNFDKIVDRARTLINLDQLFKDKSNGAKETSGSNTKGSSSSHATTGGGMPDPEKDPNDGKPKELEFKKRNFQKEDQVDLKRFNSRQSRNHDNPWYVDPKTGQYIQKERALNSGSGSHGSSAWKLFDKNGNRLATLSSDGKVMRLGE